MRIVHYIGNYHVVTTVIGLALTFSWHHFYNATSTLFHQHGNWVVDDSHLFTNSDTFMYAVTDVFFNFSVTNLYT